MEYVGVVGVIDVGEDAEKLAVYVLDRRRETGMELLA